MEQLLEAYGYSQIENVKNPLMISFKNEAGTRVNFYHTTGTITFQPISGGITTLREATLEDIEKELSTPSTCI